jgi:EAL domain-containing protein (putative c-di-GMP-specific phosphodiesterase class I)
MEVDPKAAAIVNTVVALGRTLDLTITAEGVETPEQAKALKEAGCDQGQGYLFGRPLTAAAAVELINSSDSLVTEPRSNSPIASETAPTRASV